MRCFWEQVGLLGPMYRLVGKGMSDPDIAKDLEVSALSVQDCIAWMLHFFKFTSRQELVLRASSLHIATGNLDHNVLKRIPTGHNITYVPTPNT
jgi:hypothetical protein